MIVFGSRFSMARSSPTPPVSPRYFVTTFLHFSPASSSVNSLVPGYLLINGVSLLPFFFLWYASAILHRRSLRSFRTAGSTPCCLYGLLQLGFRSCSAAGFRLSTQHPPLFLPIAKCPLLPCLASFVFPFLNKDLSSSGFRRFFLSSCWVLGSSFAPAPPFDQPAFHPRFH